MQTGSGSVGVSRNFAMGDSGVEQDYTGSGSVGISRNFAIGDFGVEQDYTDQDYGGGGSGSVGVLRYQ